MFVICLWYVYDMFMICLWLVGRICKLLLMSRWEPGFVGDWSHQACLLSSGFSIPTIFAKSEEAAGIWSSWHTYHVKPTLKLLIDTDTNSINEEDLTGLRVWDIQTLESSWTSKFGLQRCPFRKGNIEGVDMYNACYGGQACSKEGDDRGSLTKADAAATDYLTVLGWCGMVGSSTSMHFLNFLDRG